MSRKLYFIANQDDQEFCYTKKYLLQHMEDNNLQTLEVVEAKRQIGEDQFFCKEYFEVGLKSESQCGRLCNGYKPRNGKNGRCIHSGFCYEPTDKKTVLIRKIIPTNQ